MARSNEYTHGGSAGKNMYLLLRALLNIIAFGALFFGLSPMAEKLGGNIALIITIAGAVLLGICFWSNLAAPFIHRKK